MKKILLLFLLMTLVSCYSGTNEVNNNKTKIEKKEVKNNDLINNKIKSKKRNFNKKTKAETISFIKKLNKNPDILKNIKCNDFKIKETIDLCIKKQKRYLEIIGNIKK